MPKMRFSEPEQHLLFNNKVYSKFPIYDSSGFGDLCSSEKEEIRREQDEELFERMTTPDGTMIQLPYQGPDKCLFLPDPFMTKFRNEYIKLQNKHPFDYECMRKAIVDDTIPAFISQVFLEHYGENGTYESTIDHGRYSLIDILVDVKYAKAVPELREVALHDDDEGLRGVARLALQNIGNREAVLAICEILDQMTDEFHRNYVLRYFKFRVPKYRHLAIPSVRKIFYEKYYSMRPENISDEHQFYNGWTIVHEALNVLSRVSYSKKALETIVDAIEGPYKEFEEYGRKVLAIWVENNLKLLTADSRIEPTDRRVSFLKKLIWRYDLNDIGSIDNPLFQKYTLCNYSFTFASMKKYNETVHVKSN